MASVRLPWEEPPANDSPDVPTANDIASSLARRPGKWAIVAFCDRAARATAMADRINSGREYGAGYDAVARRVGNQHRVYARCSDS